MARNAKILKPNRRTQIRRISVNRMIPNILTLLALASGLTAMRFAFQERWEMAVFAIAVAAILDALDGRVARLLKGASKFGAELDSLSDFVCFGVAPAIILFLWSLQDAGRVTWVLVMLYTMCMGLRLARFNVAITDEDEPDWKNRFFSGVPAPAGAGLVLLPMILSFQTGDTYFRSPLITSGFLFFIGALLVSAIPTYSFKKLAVPRQHFLVTMLLVVLVIALSTIEPWLCLTTILFLYITAIPFSIRAYRGYQQGETIEEERGDDLDDT